MHLSFDKPSRRPGAAYPREKGVFMICPHCKSEIDYCYVYSKCVQRATIQKDGQLTDYENPEVLADTEAIECPECQKDISGSVTE